MKMNLLKAVLLLNVAGMFGAGNLVAAEAGSAPHPATPVYENYIKIQTALAADTLKGVSENAAAIARSIRETADQKWPSNLASEADKLAKADSLESARTALRPVSASLIEHWAAHPALTQKYERAYCPMAKAAWLQKGSEIQNPYMGKDMARCGTLLPKAKSAAETSGVCPQNPAMTCPVGEEMNCTGDMTGCCGK